MFIIIYNTGIKTCGKHATLSSVVLNIYIYKCINNVLSHNLNNVHTKNIFI